MERVDSPTSGDVAGAPVAPPVVAVVVVHEPGPWFDETLDALADQDYPNLTTLFLLTGAAGDAGADDAAARIRDRLPEAFVRELGANRGFGAAANEVLHLVEGDTGFFWFCHDDVAPAPDAARLLVEELYRSNAGVVGPKLVDWDDPGVLQHVGLALDRFGEVDPIIEPAERDQEQHDAVRDVFVVPTACLLVRADLFRAIGGFDDAIDLHGDDVDLCWRVHLSGARVVVVPQARVRHREELELRRPDVNHDVLRARHRMRSVATLTSARKLVQRSVELVLLTLAELVVGLFTGRFGEAWASLRALVGLIPRTPALIARRRAVAAFRAVPDQDLLGLQQRGSARLSSYLRSRDTATYVGEETSVRRWRESSLATTLAWIVVLVAVVVGSRTLIDAGVPAVGELLPFPASPRGWWNDFLAGWNPTGLGATSPNPTGWAVVPVLSVLWAFRMGLGLTVVVVGLVVLGLLGVWRLSTLFPANRSRIATLAVYAALPIVTGLVSTGRFTGLVGYAAVPWFVHLLRSAVGIGTPDPALADHAIVDGILEPPRRERVRRAAVLTLVTALAAAVAAPLVIVLAITTVVLALSSALVGAGRRTSLAFLVLGIVACAGGAVLNLPWTTSWSWSQLAPDLEVHSGRTTLDVLSMDIGRARFTVLAMALFVPVLVTLAVARSWRLTWAGRAAGLVAVSGVLAVLADRDALPFSLPDIGVLLVPVAVGLALAAGTAFAAFGDDVAGRTFGWRQPAGVVALAAVVVGCVPAVFAVTDGSWYAPRTTLNELTASYVGTAAGSSSGDDAGEEAGDSRIVFLGDPRLLPVPSTTLGGGVSVGVVDDGPLDFRDRTPADDGRLRDLLEGVLIGIADQQTLRGGRMLAPFGVRYVVVPVVDGVASTADAPLPLAVGLVASLDAQLDLARQPSPTSFLVYENTAAMPTLAMTDGALAEATRAELLTALIGVDPSGATPALTGADDTLDAAGELDAGTFHAGVAPDDRWNLTVDAEEIEARPAFGATTAYDVAAPGSARFAYTTSGTRAVALVVQALLWLAVAVLASRIRVPARLRRTPVRDETLLDLDTAAGASELPDLVGAGASAGTAAPLGGWVEELFIEDRRGHVTLVERSDEVSDEVSGEPPVRTPGEDVESARPAHGAEDQS